MTRRTDTIDALHTNTAFTNHIYYSSVRIGKGLCQIHWTSHKKGHNLTLNVDNTLLVALILLQYYTHTNEGVIETTHCNLIPARE